MRQLVALLLGGLALAACQTSRPLYPTGLYRTANEFRAQRPTPAGTSAGRVVLARKAYVKTGPGQRRKVPLDSLWGYAGANRAAFRLYRQRAYQVEQVDTLVVYSHHEGKTTRHYFSSGLAGPVTLLGKRQLKRTFAADTAFLRLLGHRKWYQSLEATQAPAGAAKSYRVVALYRQALGLPAPQRH